MSGPDTTAEFSPGAAKVSQSPAAAFQPALSGVQEEAAVDIQEPSEKARREKFIPLTVTALVDRLTLTSAWPKGEARATRRFFRYLDYWRRQQYSASLVDLLQTYEPFSPDSDLLVTRDYSPEERIVMQKRVVSQIEELLIQANYERIDPSAVEMILTKDSTYGLDLHIDFTAFEECLIYYRGATTRRDYRRRLRKFYLKEEFDNPIFQRLFLLFKLKPYEIRVREVMAEQKFSRREAEKAVDRLRSLFPDVVKEDQIYIKLFKNIPCNDLEMVFPNTRVKFRLFDKIKLGVTGGGAVGAGVFGTASKVAAGGLAITNPVALAGAIITLGGVAFRQVMGFINQKNRYMVVMAQNLYFHAMADNSGVVIQLADRAADEDVKEEILLYCVLAKESAKRSDLPAIDAAIEKYLETTFDIVVDFDLEDALRRLIADGVVREEADGTLVALPPEKAGLHIDEQWDRLLDDLPDFPNQHEGHEVEEEA